MTIVARNRLLLGFGLATLSLLIFLLQWLLRHKDVLSGMVSFVIVGSLVLALLIFTMSFLFFNKTNAPELTLLIGYALGLLVQPMRLFLIYPSYINTQTLQVFSVYLATFGYLLALITMLFIVLHEAHALLLHIEDALLYVAVILYIFVCLQPINANEVQAGYLFAFVDPFAFNLLSFVLSVLITLISLLLLFSRDDAQKPYFALTILVLHTGLHLFWLTQKLNFAIAGFALQLGALLVLFVLIRRRYLWFRWS
jgi:hypothetical protein